MRVARPLPRQLIEIILLYQELQHDITADITRLEKSRNLQATPVLTNEDADGYTIARQIDRAVNQCVSRMQAYLLLPSPFVHRISTNHTHAWEEKSIYLAMPPNWPPHCIDPLRDAVHTYIVKSVEYNLLIVSLTNDPYTVLCKTEADQAYSDINSQLSHRLGHIEIHPTPFG